MKMKKMGRVNTAMKKLNLKQENPNNHLTLRKAKPYLSAIFPLIPARSLFMTCLSSLVRLNTASCWRTDGQVTVKEWLL